VSPSHVIWVVIIVARIDEGRMQVVIKLRAVNAVIGYLLRSIAHTLCLISLSILITIGVAYDCYQTQAIQVIAARNTQIWPEIATGL
jgi:hypothetical protein